MDQKLRKFCVAPMMGFTTPHARKLYRILSKKSFLFTEMIPTKTLIHSLKRDLIIENYRQNPIALQVGGSDYRDLIECAKIAKNYNYDELNLNVGCPSKSVQQGSFGACLMKNKLIVKDCLQAMLDNFDKEVTIKCRTGIDNKNSYIFFRDFIETVINTGVKIIYVHARNAILKGLSPKENRTIPPLKYDFVKKIKLDFPEIQFIINGGINSLSQAYNFSQEYDGVMVGRLIRANPFCLSKVDNIFFNYPIKNKESNTIVIEYFNYVKKQINKDSIFRLLSPLLYIFFGIPNSKKHKIEIHRNIKNYDVEKLQNMFLEFIK